MPKIRSAPRLPGWATSWWVFEPTRNRFYFPLGNLFRPTAPTQETTLGPEAPRAAWLTQQVEADRAGTVSHVLPLARINLKPALRS